MTVTEILVFAYQRNWYKNQDDKVRRSCERIQPGMSTDEVWTVVDEIGNPHGSWRGNQVLGFWAVKGSCNVSLDHNTDRVAQREYSASTEKFVGVQ
jgi:hypothetical protein